MLSSRKIVMLLRTKSLNYDDRVRKESQMLRRLGHRVVIALVESDNNATETFEWEGVACQRVGLKSRFLPKGRFAFVKTIEMYLRFLCVIAREKPSIVWLHNMELGGMAACSSFFREVMGTDWVVWDQHELPSERILRSGLLRYAVKKAVSSTDGTIVANRQRRTISRRLGLLQAPAVVLENYAGERFVNQSKTELPSDVSDWLSGAAYFVAQGGASPRRNFDSLAEAVIRGGHRLVVVGDRPDKKVSSLCERFGAEALHRHIYFTGWVHQDEVARYIDSASAAIIFYSMRSINGRFCAPNRLYQALSRGVPVVVGVNPPMKSVVLKYRCGVVVPTDGSDVDRVVQALEKLKRMGAGTRSIHKAPKNAFVFETQSRQLEKWLLAVSRPEKSNRGDD